MVNPKYITNRAAADRLGVHPNTVRNWANEGVIKVERLPSGYIKIPLSEVERIEREGVTRATPSRRHRHRLLAIIQAGPALTRYVCTCGKIGRATRAYNGDDILSKAVRNHKQHAKRKE